MNTVLIKYWLNPEGQKQALKRGMNSAAHQTATVRAAEIPESLWPHVRVAPNGTAEMYIGGYDLPRDYPECVPIGYYVARTGAASPPTCARDYRGFSAPVTDWRAWLREYPARVVAEKAACEAEEKRIREDVVKEALSSGRVECGQRWAANDPRVAAMLADQKAREREERIRAAEAEILELARAGKLYRQGPKGIEKIPFPG